jgi:hypothetical protein
VTGSVDAIGEYGNTATHWYAAAVRAIAVLVAVVLLLKLVLAGVGSAKTLPRNARVVGKVSLCEGPLHPGIPDCTTFPPKRALVAVIGSPGNVVVKQATQNGRFSFSLRPGRYTLVAQVNGASTRRSVVAKADKTVYANLVFGVCQGLPRGQACPL